MLNSIDVSVCSSSYRKQMNNAAKPGKLTFSLVSKRLRNDWNFTKQLHSTYHFFPRIRKPNKIVGCGNNLIVFSLSNTTSHLVTVSAK